jgi:hypothetical protein
MLIAIVITLTIFDNGIFVLQRNPLAVAFGAQSRAKYIERVNPSYAALIQIMDELTSQCACLQLVRAAFLWITALHTTRCHRL